MDRFWLVWREDGASPHKRHATRASAEAEAIRLATKEVKSFYVVEAVAMVHTTITVVTNYPVQS